MSGGGPLRDLLSPGPSLDNDPEDDEDFVASEGDDGSAAESDNDSSSSSDEEGGSSSDSASQRSPDVAPEVLQALRAIQAQYDDVVFDEDILSESDISKQFPEEDDREALRELESDADGHGDEPVGNEGPGPQAEQVEVQQQQQQQVDGHLWLEAAAGTAAAAAARDAAPDGRAGAVVGEDSRQPAGGSLGPHLQQLGQVQLPLRLDVAGDTGACPGLPVTSQQQAGRTPAFGAPAAGASDWAVAAAAVGAAAEGAAGGGGDVLAFGAVLGSLVGERDDAIARRTRAHHPLTEFTLEELEELLQADDELEEAGRQDEEEYQRFLQSLRDLPDLPPGFDLEAEEEEEEEDEDFAVELAGLLAGGSGEDEKENRGQKRRRLAPRKPRAPRQRWVRRAEERQLESAAALRERRLLPLVPKGLGPLAPEVLPQTLGVMAAVLPELALGGGHRPLGSGQEPAVAAGAGEQLTARAPVVWRPPLDAVAEGTKTRQAAQQLYPSRTGPWLALPNAFQPAQYRLLHRLLHQHVQLLTQVYAMAAASDAAQDAQVAQQAADMLRELHRFSECQTHSRQAAGIPAYDMDQLELQPLPGSSSSLQEPAAAADAKAPPFALLRPLTDVHTIADLALLRQVPGLLASLPLPAAGDTAGSTAAGALAAAPTLSLQDGGAEADAAGTIAAAAAVVAAAAAAELPPKGGVAAGASETGTHPGMEQAGACLLAAAPAPTAEPAPAILPALAAVQGGKGGATHMNWLAESEEEKRRRRQKKRGRKKPKEHQLWQSLSGAAQLALTPLLPLYDPALTPQPPPFVPSTQLLFLPSEDELLALGLRRHGYDWKRIREELLPTKTEGQLFNRKKNRVGGSAPSNCIKDIYQRMHAPLRPDECALLEQAVAFYGKQPHRWELICRNHLPHRHPNTLAVLWSQRTNGASVVKKKAQHKVAAATASAAAQGLRPVFLSNMDDLPQQQQQAQHEQQAAQPPGQVPAGRQAQPGSRPLLQPRWSLEAPGQQLHTLLHQLFPGMDIPFPLQLAAAVHACAAMAGVALPVPLLALVTPGAPAPPGMMPMGVIDWPALPAWQEAVSLAQPRSTASAQPEQQQPGQEGRRPEAQERNQQARLQDGLPGVHPASQPAALSALTAAAPPGPAPGPQPGNLTICSPARDIAAELQRLLTGEDSGGAERFPLLSPQGAAAAAGARPRRRRNDRWKSLFQGQGEAGRQQQGAAPTSLAGTRQQQQQQPGAVHGSWSQDSWGLGGAEDLFQPVQLMGLPPAPALAAAGAAGPLSHGQQAPDVRRGPRVAEQAAARQVASKGPRKRVHFEFDREELEDSEDDKEGPTSAAAGPYGGAGAAVVAAPPPSCQLQQPLRPQRQSQRQRQRFDAEELSDSKYDPETQHSRGTGPSAQQQPTAPHPVAAEKRASSAGKAGAESPGKGTQQWGPRQESQPKPPPSTRRRNNGDAEDGAGPAVLAQSATTAVAAGQSAVEAALRHEGMHAMLADRPLQPPALPAGGTAQLINSQQPGPCLQREQQPSSQQPSAPTQSASGRQTRSQASGGRHTRSTAAAAAVPAVATRHGRQRLQQAPAPIFEQEELPDSSDEDDGAKRAQPGGRSSAPGGPSLGGPAGPAASMPAASTRAQVKAAQRSTGQQLDGQGTGALQNANPIASRAEPSAAEAPPLQAAAAVARPAPPTGAWASMEDASVVPPDAPSHSGPAASPAAVRKSRRAASQQARRQITAWVGGGNQGPGQEQQQRQQAPADSTAEDSAQPAQQHRNAAPPSTTMATQRKSEEGKLLPGIPSVAAGGVRREGPAVPASLPEAGTVPAPQGSSRATPLLAAPAIRPSSVRAPAGAGPTDPSEPGHAVVEGAAGVAMPAAAATGLASMPAAATAEKRVNESMPPSSSAPTPAQEGAAPSQSAEAAAPPELQLVANRPLTATQLGAAVDRAQGQPQLPPAGAKQPAAQASGVGHPPHELAPSREAVVPAAPPAAEGQDGQPPAPVLTRAVGELSSSSSGWAWPKDEDRLLLKAVLAANGKLSSEQLEGLLTQVGGEAAGRSLAAVEERCAEVLERFTRLAQERKRRQQQQQQ